MHKIDSYSFGRIVIDGKKYTNDVIITQDKIYDNWWRQDGHSLCMEDLEEILELAPSNLVLGKGASGRMDIPNKIKNKLGELGFSLHIDNTRNAVKQYNELANNNTIGAFHLTC